MKYFWSKFYFLIFSLAVIITSVFIFLQFQGFEKDISGFFIANTALVSDQRFNDKISLVFAGDIMLDRGVELVIDEQSDRDYRFPFLNIADYLNKADIVFGNLEGPVSDKGIKVGSIYSFRSDPEAVEGLSFAGFNVLSIANNHVFDYSREAMEDTFLRLKEAGIDYVGGGFNENEAHQPLIKQVKGLKVAFLAYTNLGSEYWQAKDDRSGIAWLDAERVEQDIKKAKSISDIIVVSFHYGNEYQEEPSSFQISISQQSIDWGADLVIGHHPHVPQPVEKYNNGYIAYSLGNFVFDQYFSKETMQSILLEVSIRQKTISNVVVKNIQLNEFFQPEIVP